MDKPLLLDCYCKAGGTSRGYQMAGFRVVGNDIEPQKHYIGDDFILMDALELLQRLIDGESIKAKNGQSYKLSDFAAIAASPPCQAYSRTHSIWGREYPKLINDTRKLLVNTNKPYIIENVIGSQLINPVILCGLMFGLRTFRHRLFETNFDIPSIYHPQHTDKTSNLVGKPTGRTYIVTVCGKARYAGASADWREAMQIYWMTEGEISQAVPPIYCEYIGKQLMKSINPETQS